MTDVTTPAIHGQATLSLPTRETVAARVDAQGEGWAEITLLAAPQTPIAVLERAELFLEYRGEGGGSFRVLGGLRGGNSSMGGPLGFIGAVRFEFRGAPEVLHRRAFVRTDYVARVFMASEDGVGGAAPCVTMNVSGGGLLLRGLQGRNMGEDLRFHLELAPNVPHIVGGCKVVRRTPEGFVGVQFTTIEDADRDRLIAFAEHRERLRRGN